MAKEKDPNIEAIKAFIKDVKSEHEVSGAKEQSYRPDLVGFIRKLCDSKTRVRNEGKQTDGVTPDIVVMRKPDNIPIGYIEAKDIDKDIDNLTGANINQLALYKGKFRNLIYTNNFDWNFYRDGNLVRSISIAEIKNDKIIPIVKNYADLVDYLLDFLNQRPKTIKSAKELTEYMARKTIIIRDAFNEGLSGVDRLPSLERQYKILVRELIKGLKKDEFSDIYAQTVTYGLFIARLNTTPEDLNREKLQELVPENYSFLKDLFEFIATKTLGKTLDLYIDDLIEIYRATDDGIMKNYKNKGDGKDPFLHFYEDFLKRYDPKKRKEHGVYYTPDAVVDFIVRGVDWVLKHEFNLQDGLASTEKTSENPKIHKVQILDPATGTGTFLAHAINHIEQHVRKESSGSWPAYIDTDLLPRMHGLEIMMAPYIMCYLKLNMLLAKLDYIPKKKNPERMSIYLTNSLTGANEEISDLGFNNDWLEDEAQGAKDIKDNRPIMCVIGNPPYARFSQNMGASAKWINSLIEDYRYTDGVHFKERKNWLHNDYVKFIRFAQHMVDKNDEGVVGMITAHGYLYNPTFRGMRWHLMNSFDKIYILDLHGNTREEPYDPDGNLDKNVFDITVGVSIIIAWRRKWTNIKDKPLAQVFRGDLWGLRDKKFKDLGAGSLDSGLFQKIEPRKPFYFFTPQNYDISKEHEKLEEYEKGFKITDFMAEKSVGIMTSRDSLTIDSDSDKLWKRVNNFAKLDIETARETYDLGEDSTTWTIQKAQSDVINNLDKDNITPFAYRPFDTRFIYYTGNSGGFVCRPIKKTMRNFREGPNFGLVIGRQGQAVGSMPWNLAFVQDKMSDLNMFYRGGGTVFPLYLYFNKKNQASNTADPNMNPKIRKAIEDAATDSKHKKPDEKEIFDYIYGLLHAPGYRERYAESLKSDFPRIPYPKTPAEFWHLSSVGTKLRELHLMPKSLDTSAYTFDGKGDGTVKYWNNFEDGQIWINDTQYFGNIPESAWNFYIGGYQPAQLWLKKRMGQKLDYGYSKHYQKIIAVLVQTEQTMQTIKWSRP